MRSIVHSIRLLLLASLLTSALAQEVSIPDPGLNAAIRQALQKPAGPLTEQDLLQLTGLNATGRNIATVAGLEAARNLFGLDLFNNHITNFSLPSQLTNLVFLDISANPLTNCSLPLGLAQLQNLVIESTTLTNLTLPAGMIRLAELDLVGNRLTRFAVPLDMTNLTALHLPFNQLTNFTLPANLTRLGNLDLDFNQLQSLTLPPGLTSLGTLFVGGNQLTNLIFPGDMTNVAFVNLIDNELRNVALPWGLTRLTFLGLAGNQLTSLSLPSGLTNLTSLFLQTNQLTNLVLPPDLIHLVQLDLRGNNLAALTLPPDPTQLSTLLLDGNPLTQLVLSEPLAAGNLFASVEALRNQGIPVFTYPLSIHLTLTRQQPIDAFRFAITGLPGTYTIFSSTNLTDWTASGTVQNPLGSVLAIDTTVQFSPHKFYRALLQTPPTNMVFIPANTFTMGSPTNEVGRLTDEGPQTTVTLTHGFWMAKFLVTQRDYLAVIGSNPSGFPGDLNRPVESVSWLDATNYCAKLTEQDLAAGRIGPGSHYRLPTEAEWECGARAGTSTRFNYGDDPSVTDLAKHAWYSANSGFGTRPVGLKEPNAWGLYDMAGNVWEWCQDWYGPYSGGSAIDPKGPDSNPIGFKVIRGGAWESFESDCRSARRSIEGMSPFIKDFIIGFRVVLVTET
jgi:formylglycine-generating enzyme required for sulfatase activity